MSEKTNLVNEEEGNPPVKAPSGSGTDIDTLPLNLVAIVWDYLVGNFGRITDQRVLHQVAQFARPDKNVIASGLQSRAASLKDGLMFCYVINSLQPTITNDVNHVIQEYSLKQAFGYDTMTLLSMYRYAQLTAERNNPTEEHSKKFNAIEYQEKTAFFQEQNIETKVRINRHMEHIQVLRGKAMDLSQKVSEKQQFFFESMAKENDRAVRQAMLRDFQLLRNKERAFWSSHFKKQSHELSQSMQEIFGVFDRTLETVQFFDNQVADVQARENTMLTKMTDNNARIEYCNANFSVIEDENKVLTESNEALKNHFNILTENYVNLQAEHDKTTEEFEDLRLQHQEMNSQLSSTQSEIRTLTEELSDYTEVKGELAETVKRLDATVVDLDSSAHDNSKLLKRIKELETALEATQLNHSDLAAEHEKVVTAHSELQGKHEVLSNKHEELTIKHADVTSSFDALTDKVNPFFLLSLFFSPFSSSYIHICINVS